MRRAIAFLLVPLSLVISTPAHAQSVRICTIFTSSGQTSTWAFTIDGILGGTWTHTIAGRTCIGTTGAPANITVSGTYLGNVCVAAELVATTGNSIGVVAAGATAVTHAGPDAGFLAIESVSVFTFGQTCNPTGNNTFTADTIQVHVLP